MFELHTPHSHPPPDIPAPTFGCTHRPQPGDGDWQLLDGGASTTDGPAPARQPAIVPASFPNQVHPSLRREETFKKLSSETCFFAVRVWGVGGARRVEAGGPAGSSAAAPPHLTLPACPPHVPCAVLLPAE